MATHAPTRDTGDPVIYANTRLSRGTAPAGTTVSVRARRSPNGVVGISWERSDISRVQTIALTPAEFDGIARALGYRKALAR